jgi:hypothetical protein
VKFFDASIAEGLAELVYYRSYYKTPGWTHSSVGTRHMLDLPRSSIQHDIIRCERLSHAGASTLRPVSPCKSTGVPGGAGIAIFKFNAPVTAP